jgi:hypothetical protein
MKAGDQKSFLRLHQQKLNGDFVNIIRVINGVFLNLLKWQTVLKPQKAAYAPCGWE